MTRVVMWALLGIVAASAAVLSFSALRDLADLCGFHRALSPLLPGVVDAGAAAGCLVWLSPKDVTTEARRFARALTWLLLASSVAGNAIVHGLSAYGLRPHWTLVVAVSAVAPVVLGAVVHLSVLVGRDAGRQTGAGASEPPTPEAAGSSPGASPRSALANAPEATEPLSTRVEPTPVKARAKRTTLVADTDSLLSKTHELLAENPKLGRRRLMKALDLEEYDARKLLEQARSETPRNGARVLEDA